ncbi:MAG TPA: polysaccharide deacetylase family protein [Cytophagaceae bacterium]|jgi:hypothetical protein
MLLIHSQLINNRVAYIFKFLFGDILKVDFRLTDNHSEFIDYKGAKFSYGRTAFNDRAIPHFASVDLLFETDVYKQNIEFEKANETSGEVYFYKVKDGTLPFDVFASSFYLLTRYEEYLPHVKDKYGRFNPEDAAAYRGNFLDRPLINSWAMQLKEILLKHYPTLHFPFIPFVFKPTINIDNAYSFKYKGAVRIIFSLLGLLITFNFKTFYQRMLIHLGMEKDPFDTYEKQLSINKQYNLKPIYFILLGNNGKFDKNNSFRNKGYINLINKLEKEVEIGFHPSYISCRSEKQLVTEKSRLEKIIGRKVTKSRHHYIKLDLPITYQLLTKAGIEEDYSMGYPTKIGFRASTCTSFNFFDLQKNEETNLKVHPFIIMDSTLKKYLHVRSKDVITYLLPLVESIKKTGGTFMFIFHNESMGGGKVWKNWGEVYERFIKLALAKSVE